MKALVLDLQKEAYDSNTSISTLLRKAYVVARKLKTNDFEVWINSELNGYKCSNDEIPEYRMIRGEVKGWNPYHGWIPVILDDTKLANLLSVRRLSDPITNLEVLTKSDQDSLTITFNNDVRKSIAHWVDFDTKFQMFFSKSQVESIIESVRNIVLEWSLKLEEDGILGEGMKFTDSEKNIAQKNNYTTNVFNGNVTNSQIQQNSNNSTQNMSVDIVDKQEVERLIGMIKDNIKDIKLGEEEINDINSQIKTIESILETKKPKKSMITECFTTIRSILEGVAGSVIASGLIYQLSLFSS